jgi:hypothetical protein
MAQITEVSNLPLSELGAVMGDYRPIQRETNRRRIREAARLYSDALSGRIEPFLLKQAMNPTHEIYVEHLARQYPGIYGESRRQVGLRETMSFSDYQALFVDVLDRQYYGWYNAYPIVNMPLVRRHTAMDFRIIKRYMYDGLVTPWTQVDPGTGAPMTSLTGPVPQGGADPATSSTAAIEYQPAAFQAGASINWRAFVNDDLGIFRDVPQRLAIEGNRGTSKFITQQFFDVNGPSATLYTSAYGNQIITANGASSSNPELNAQGLSDAFKIAAGMLDDTGNPILITGKMYLVYGPAYVAAVKNLMNQVSVQVSVEGGTTNSDGFPSQFVQVNNWMTAELTPIMDPYIPLIATAHKKSWILVVDPGSVNRPAVEFAQYKGFETPQLFQRVPNIQRVGGGIETTMGSYDNLNSDMKIIGVHGAGQMDGRCTFGSNGSGS